MTVTRNYRDLKAADSVERITAAKTLKGSDSNKAFVLVAATGAAITLPALQSGWRAKFYVGSAFGTTDWTIVSSTDVIQGYAGVNFATVAASAENTISFVATAETVGDYVEVFCDGTNWLVSGQGSLAGSITFTAP